GLFRNDWDPYRGVAVKAESDMPRYLKGVADLKEATIEKRLRFFFDYLENDDPEISNDAYQEFARAEYKDYRGMAKDLPPDRVAGWLTSTGTSPFRIGLYASMLGHCGKEQHASALRTLLDDPEKRVNTGVDGVLAGYAMLQPKEGWKYIRGILS